MRSFILGVLVLANTAFANTPSQVAMPVGHSATVSLPSSVSKVKVADPELVDVSMSGRKVTFTGLKRGATEVTVVMKDGEQQLRVYVAADKYGMPAGQ